MNNDPVYERQKAYQYIVSVAKNSKMWIPNINSDKQLADLLGVPMDELIALKRGLANPSPKLVESFKQFACGDGGCTEEQVNAFLVDPFKRKSIKPKIRQS
jgi:hypothetical protein